MGRTIPSSITTTPPPPLPLLAAGIAASLAIFFTLCFSYHRKSSSTRKSQSQSIPFPTPSTSSSKHNLQQEFTPPPQSPREQPQLPTLTPQRRRLSMPMSLSMRFADTGLSKIRTRAKKEKHGKAASISNATCSGSHEHNASVEESVWMKTIILGEKCKVPSEEEDEDEDMVVYDDKGNKKKMYHPRTPRSLPVSRTNSFAVAESGFHGNADVSIDNGLRV